LTILEEQLLLHRVRSYDRSVAEKLIDEFYSRIYRFVYSICHNRETARDLTQETFYRFWQKLDSYQNRCRLITWLFQIAYHAFLDDVKRKKSHGEQISVYEIELSVPAQESGEDLARLLKELPEEQRNVIILFYYEDLSIKQIAKILEIPPGTVKSRLHNAKAKLKDLVLL
jgi:RNA polymerase sigma-70 factor, ECF subfamily